MSDFTIGKIVFAPKADEQDEKLINDIIARNHKPEKIISLHELQETIERQQEIMGEQLRTITALIEGVEAYGLPPETTPVIRYIAAMEERIVSQQAEIERLRISHSRYEKLRRLCIEEFKRLVMRNITTGEPFDKLVDRLPDKQEALKHD